MSTRKSRPIWPWVAVLVLGGGAFGAYSAGWFRSDEVAPLQGATVQRGPLVISVVQRGNLAAKDAFVVSSEIEGQTTILDLVPEGTQVQPGDKLVELDVASIVEKKIAQDIAVQNADAAFVKAKAQYDIQVSQNKSDIEAAERKRDFAKIDLEKYVGKSGERAQLIAQADEKIAIAQAEKSTAENTKKWSTDLAEKKFLTMSELERDVLDFQRAEISLTQAVRAKQLLMDFDDPRKVRELEANLEEAERGLERTKLQATARIVDFDAAVKTSDSKLQLEREKLNKYIDQIKKGTIVAGVAGSVVYARVDSGRMGGSEPIKKGSQVRERDEILSIPRSEGLIAEASVHESVLMQVLPGMPCRIRVDALASAEFDGTVRFVARYADKASWWANPNQRLYKAEIAVSQPNPDMRPGMSCSVEIFSDRIEDCLYVPVQAVMLHDGARIAFVAKSTSNEMRKITVGKASDKWVQVLSGLEAGETVLLAPPPGFTPKASDAGGAAPMARNPAMPARGDANGGAPADALPANGAPAGARDGAGAGNGEPRRERRNRGEGGGAPRGDASGAPRGERDAGERPAGDAATPKTDDAASKGDGAAGAKGARGG